MAGTITVSGMSTGEPGGYRVLGPFTIAGSVVIGETIAAPLTTGDNTFAIPTGATGCLIVPPVGAVAMTLRTSLNASDAGLPLNLVFPMVYPLPVGATSLIVHPASAQSLPLTIAFI